jgi:hypothetical protein
VSGKTRPVHPSRNQMMSSSKTLAMIAQGLIGRLIVPNADATGDAISPGIVREREALNSALRGVALVKERGGQEGGLVSERSTHTGQPDWALSFLSLGDAVEPGMVTSLAACAAR